MVATMPARLTKGGDPIAPVLREAIDIATALPRIASAVTRGRP